MTIEQFRDRMAALGRGGLQKELIASMRVVGLRAERLVKDGYLSGAQLNVRSGRLRGSIGYEVTIAGGGAELHLRAGGGTKNVRYARLHEKGGTIRPTQGQFLAIPVGPAKTGAGVARYASARDVPDLRYVQLRGGQPALVKEVGRGRGKDAGKIEVWYLLRRSVMIPARPYMAPALQLAKDALGPVLAERLLPRLRGA